MANPTYIIHDMPTPVHVTETGTDNYIYESIIINETTTVTPPPSAVNIAHQIATHFSRRVRVIGY